MVLRTEEGPGCQVPALMETHIFMGEADHKQVTNKSIGKCQRISPRIEIRKAVRQRQSPFLIRLGSWGRSSQHPVYELG